MTDLNSADVDQLLRIVNMRTYLEFEAAKLGTEQQLTDYAKGCLRETDLRILARDHLFAPFRDLPRWTPMPYSAVTHKRSGCVGRVNFEVGDGIGTVPDYADHYAQARKIGDLSIEAGRHQWLLRSGVGFSVTIRNHVAACTACGAREERLSALVTVEWAARTLSREFAL